jgi:DNA mismatch repair protein MutS
MIQQYKRAKCEHPDKILMFRLGDFYEMFYEDAEVASRELDITLTARPAGKDGKIPMAGVPYHAVESYLERLVSRGYKVAICDQVEEPGQGKALVRREITRIVTPGTCVDLRTPQNNYLASLSLGGGGIGLAVADASTGEFRATEFRGEDAAGRAQEELLRTAPSECLVGPSVREEASWNRFFSQRLRCVLTQGDELAYDHETAYRVLTGHFGTLSLRGFGLEDEHAAIAAAGALLGYLQETHRTALAHMTAISRYSSSHYMALDSQTRRNLELTQTLAGQKSKGSLLWVLDSAVTSLGQRLLRHWITHPLLCVRTIEERLDAVEFLVKAGLQRASLRGSLKGIRDLERLMARIAYGSAGPRDLVALRASLEAASALPRHLEGARGSLAHLPREMPDLGDLTRLLEEAVEDDPPLLAREGGFVKPGYRQEIDHLRELARGGRSWISQFETSERQRTGIKSLKVGYNRVFGYYVEVTRANLSQVPSDYQRRQTLANAERFVTEELKAKEEAILGSEERMQALEYEVFMELRDAVLARAAQIQRVASVVAQADVLATLAEVAAREGYVRPLVDQSTVVEITGGRHPVLEKVLDAGAFVPNDSHLDTQENRFLVITGPNMAGKSTYLRQVALICLMAQMGGFVPASRARIGVIDKLFTRVGAWDDLVMGQSTFMVEMTEVAHILHNATERSLIILDEIGRGTSTYDGLSIAWAVSEYILDRERIGAKTLFATHYREMVQMEEGLDGVRNFSVAIKRRGDDMVFLRRLVRGGSDGSYGIDVARLAGLPRDVTERARQILRGLEEASGRVSATLDPPAYTQISFLEPGEHPVLEELRNMKLLEMTPLEALQELYRLQGKARKGS